MTCCASIEDLGCIYSCDLVQIGINAPATGIYTLVLMPDLIQVVSTTITISTPIYFSGGYLNEDGRSIFKVLKPDGTYLTSGTNDCFQVDIRPTVNATLADLDLDPVTCEDATAVLKNSALTTISTTTIASGATTTITAPDATAVLKNSAGTVIDTEAIPSNVSEDITIANVAWTDSDGSAESTPYGNAIVCTPQQYLTVNFSANDTTPETNQVITFTDLTTGANKWMWDFGDNESSDLQNPTHAYKYAGTYTVTLHADNGIVGGYEEKVGYIVVTLQTLYQTSLQMWNKAPTGASPSNMTLVAGAVSQWDDSIGGFNRTQAIAASRPAYTELGYTAPDGTVYGIVTYDGAGDRLINNSAGLTRASGSYEVFLIKVATSKIGAIVDSGSSAGYLFYQVAADGGTRMYNGTDSSSSQGLQTQKWVLIKLYWNGASSTLQIDDATEYAIPNNIGTTSRQGSIQGSNFGNTTFSKIVILEHAIYSAKPSAGDIAAYIDNYFNSKFGIW